MSADDGSPPGSQRSCYQSVVPLLGGVEGGMHAGRSLAAHRLRRQPSSSAVWPVLGGKHRRACHCACAHPAAVGAARSARSRHAARGYYLDRV